MKLFHAIIAFAFICCTHTATAQGTKTSSTFNDADITFKEVFDEIEVINPETGETAKLSKKRGDIALSLNGIPIYEYDAATEPVGGASQTSLESYLQANFLLEELDKGRGAVDNIDIIIDDKGSVSFVRIFFRNADGNKVTAMQRSIEQKLRSKTFVPATKDGKAVPYRINIKGL